MNSVTTSSTSKTVKRLLYPSLFIIGILILLFCSTIQPAAAPNKGEYHYSSFIIHNFTYLSNVIFIFTGFFAGYFFRLNPWLSGICLFLIFPLTAMIEGTVYRGSHNLIPF